MNEFERIDHLRACFAPRGASPEGLVLGIGDDAAVLAATANLAVSVDTAVEGVHFRPQFADWSTLGARAFSAALSDLAAMGAQPRAALLALITPPALDDAAFLSLIHGYGAAAEHYGCPVVGGNLSSGGEVSITTTVLGDVQGRGLTRAGAQVGDEIFVTGTLGAAALGFLLLEANTPELGPGFVERWRHPRARIAEGAMLAGLATAAIDVSDGALQDLSHLCVASGVGAELRANAIPLPPEFADVALRLGVNPLELALTAGEDYELLYTVPASTVAGPGTRIGTIVPREEGISIRDEHGRALPLPMRGYRHFQG